MKRFILNVSGNFTGSIRIHLNNSKFVRKGNYYQKHYLFDSKFNDFYCAGHIIYDIFDIVHHSDLTKSENEKIVLKYSTVNHVIKEHKYNLIFPNL